MLARANNPAQVCPFVFDEAFLASLGSPKEKNMEHEMETVFIQGLS